MARRIEGRALYVVRFQRAGEAEQTETFTGGRAFTEAHDRLDRLRRDAGVVRVSLVRLDGAEFQWVVAPLRRGEDGEWVGEG